MNSNDSSPNNLYEDILIDESDLTQQHEQIQINPELIKTVTKPCYGLCAHAVSLNGLVLEFIDEQNYEICRIAIQQNPRALQFVRKQTSELCRIAVSIDGTAIQYVYDQTNELCIIAITQNPASFMHIRNTIWLPPEEYINPILGAYIIRKSPFNIGRIKNQYHELCLLAVALNGMAIREIRNQTDDVCAIAINQNGLAIAYIQNQTPNLCMLALQKTPSSYSCIRTPTYEIALEAVKIDGYLVSMVYSKYKTPELLLAAIKNNCEAIKVIKPSEQTLELCLFCVKHNPMVLRYIANKTDEICKVALALDGRAIQYIDHPTDEFCKLAIKSNWHALQYIINPSKELCELALSINKDASKYIYRTVQYRTEPINTITDNKRETKNENITPKVDDKPEQTSMQYIVQIPAEKYTDKLINEMHAIEIKCNNKSIKTTMINDYQPHEQGVIPVNPIPVVPTTIIELHTADENVKSTRPKKPVDKDVFKFFVC